jgi:hypothetical protein
MPNNGSVTNSSELIEVTRAYVALSNAHRLDWILPMFDQQATYLSAYVGEFRGRDAIAGMMADFFSRYPNVRWQVGEYKYLADNTVGFNFDLVATDRQTGELVERSAYEQLKFSEDGYIERLEVRNR